MSVSLHPKLGAALYKIKGGQFGFTQFQNEPDSDETRANDERRRQPPTPMMSEQEIANTARAAEQKRAKEIMDHEERKLQARADAGPSVQNGAVAAQSKSGIVGGIVTEASDSIQDVLFALNAYTISTNSADALAQASAINAHANASDLMTINETYNNAMSNATYGFEKTNAERHNTALHTKFTENQAIRAAHLAKFQADINQYRESNKLMNTIGRSLGGLFGLFGTSMYTVSKDAPEYTAPTTNLDASYQAVSVWGSDVANLNEYQGWKNSSGVSNRPFKADSPKSDDQLTEKVNQQNNISEEKENSITVVADVHAHADEVRSDAASSSIKVKEATTSETDV